MADHDRIIETLPRGTPAPRATRWAGWIALGAALSGAIGAVVFVVGAGRRPDGEARDFTAKGAAAAPVLTARCLGRSDGGCKLGDKLAFEVDGAMAQAGLLAAYVERADGERVWFFPTSGRHFPTVPAGEGRRLVSEAARLGDEVGPGKHKLWLYIVDGRMDREAIVAGAQRPRVAAAIPLLVTP
jgi:hypothetical protein